MIKHLSFDFWDTLYAGNPNFRIARAEYIKDMYGFSTEQVHTAVKKTKKLCDDTSEKTMCTVDSMTQAWHLLDNLGCASVQGAISLSEATNSIFLRYPPKKIFHPSELISIRNSGRTISISCNTGLISGNSIVQMLKNTGAYDLFDFTLFSDQINFFKPSPFFMEIIVDHQHSNADKAEDVLHIGDNVHTDGYLCQLTGANYLQNEKGTLDFEQIKTLLL